jgi:hypothetical protein
MTSFPERRVRITGLNGKEAQMAASVLGREHPLARALSLENAVTRQLLVAFLALSVAGAAVLARVDVSWILLGAAAFVFVMLVAGLVFTRHLVRVRACRMLADGQGSVLLPAVNRERRRLASRRERQRLARSLEQLLRDARRWNEIAPLYRPLPGVECLQSTGEEVEAIVALLRSERARTQGVAMTEVFLTSGSESPLYSGDVEVLREELNRIRYVLEDTGSTAEDLRATRSAA